MTGVFGDSELVSASAFGVSDSIVDDTGSLSREASCGSSLLACSEPRVESSFVSSISACALFFSSSLAGSGTNASRMNSCPGSRAAEEILDHALKSKDIGGAWYSEPNENSKTPSTGIAEVLVSADNGPFASDIRSECCFVNPRLKIGRGFWSSIPSNAEVFVTPAADAWVVTGDISEPNSTLDEDGLGGAGLAGGLGIGGYTLLEVVVANGVREKLVLDLESESGHSSLLLLSVDGVRSPSTEETPTARRLAADSSSR